MSTFGFTFIPGSGTATVVIDGGAHSIDQTHLHYEQIKNLLIRHTKEPDNHAQIEADLSKLIDIPKSITKQTHGKITVEHDTIIYDGKPLHNSLTARILAILREGFDINNLLLFLEQLMQNPSYRSIQELYDFLEHKGLPITSDGHFLAYKAVRADFKDKYSGTFDNTVGKIVEITRGEVDDDRSHECSNGLHVGAIDYVSGYRKDDDVIVIVKVNPKDAVSVPRDHNATKLRVCRYEVVDILKSDDPLHPKAIEAAVHTGYDPVTEDEDEDEDEDECENCGEYDCYGECEYEEDDSWVDDEDDEDEEETCDCPACGGW
jgi:hypothetical protein